MARYNTTRWTLVRRAGGAGDEGRKALGELLGIYKRNIDDFLKYKALKYGLREDAADLSQEFVTQLIARSDVSKAGETSMFRTYLTTAMDRFLKNRIRAAMADKRREDIKPSEGDSALEDHKVPSPLTPEQEFERGFARATVARALQELEAEAQAKGNVELFRALRPSLLEGGQHGEDNAIAALLDMRPNAVAMARYKLRARMDTILRQHVADLVSTDIELIQELEFFSSTLTKG